MPSETLERAILLLAETQRAIDVTNKMAIVMLAIEIFLLFIALYLVWQVRNDTTYIKHKLGE